MASRGKNPRVAVKSTFDDGGTKKAERALGRLNTAGKKSIGGLTKTTLGYGAALVGGAGIVGGLEASVHAAEEAEKSQAKLDTQLKAVGISYKAHSKEIDEVVAKTSGLTGFLDKDLNSALANIVRSTGNLHSSYKLLGLATDVARTKNIDVASAGQLVGRIYAGNTRVLKSLGIALDPVTTAQDRLKASTKNATDEQKRAAVAADKTATSQKAVGLLQQKLGGQAKAYGETTAGSTEKFKAAVEGLEAKLGSALAPTISTVATKAAKFVTQMRDGTGAGGRFADKMKQVADDVGKVVGVLVDSAKWLGKHPGLLKAAGAAWVAYKSVALIQLAQTKLAMLGIFSSRSTAAATTAAGQAGGRAGRAYKAAFILGATVGLYNELSGPFNAILERLTGQINATDPTNGEGQRRADQRAARGKGDKKSNPGYGPRLQKTDPKYQPKLPKKRRGKSASASSAGPVATASRTFSKSELMGLWIRAGGPAAVADTAAAIALAESGGNASVVNSIGATGLWQIHPGGPQYLDPMANARAAVAKYNDSLRRNGDGFLPWTTYTGADTPGHAKTYLQYTGGGTKATTPSGSSGGGSAGGGGSAPAPRPKTPYEKLENSLGYMGLQVDAGTVGEEGGLKRQISAINRALPQLHGSDRLRALATRRSDQQQLRDIRKQRADDRQAAQQDYAERKAGFYDRTLSNPWLTAYLTHQDYLVATGAVSQEQGNANKAAALQGAINSGKLSEGDVVSAMGQIRDLGPGAGAGAVANEGDLLSEIDLHQRAGDITDDQARAQKIASLQAALGSWVLTDRERLELRAELGDLTNALTDNTAQLQQQNDLQKQQLDLAQQALTVAQSEERVLGRALASQVGLLLGNRLGTAGLTPTNSLAY